MKFMEAKKKLLKIAEGRFCCLDFKNTIFGYKSNKEETECSIYIEGYGYEQGSTWEKSLEKMRMKMHNITKPNEEIPEI